jgi:hypothetical protein
MSYRELKIDPHTGMQTLQAKPFMRFFGLVLLVLGAIMLWKGYQGYLIAARYGTTMTGPVALFILGAIVTPAGFVVLTIQDKVTFDKRRQLLSTAKGFLFYPTRPAEMRYSEISRIEVQRHWTPVPARGGLGFQRRYEWRVYAINLDDFQIELDRGESPEEMLQLGQHAAELTGAPLVDHS